MAKKSFAKAVAERADAILSQQDGPQQQEAPTVGNDAPMTPQAPAVAFTKFTVPLRSDQLSRLARTVAQIMVDHRVELSKAVIIRHGLDLVLALAESDPGALLQALQELERRELAANADRKYSISSGLAEWKP